MSRTRNLRKSSRHIVSLLGLSLVMTVNARADMLIDDFTDAAAWSQAGAGSFSEAVSGVIGGVREVEYDFGSAYLASANSLTLIPGAGLLVSGTANLPGLDNVAKHFRLSYGGLAASDYLHVDMSHSTAIVVNAMADFWASDLGASQMSMSLTDNLGHVGTLAVAPGLAPNLFGEIVFDLANPAFGGVNLAHVDRISLAYTSALSADTYFDSIAVRPSYSPVAQPVPEADSVLLMLLGLGLVAGLARRRA